MRARVLLHESGLHTGSGKSYNGSVPPGIDTGGSVKRSGHTAREPGRWLVMLMRTDPFRDLDRLTQQTVPSLCAHSS